MKSNTDDIHKLTEAVYKNLVENFNSGVRQILLTGKAYYKALQAVTVAANAYNGALGQVGSAAKVCRGGTEEIGEAILQIAEAQREIQSRFEDSTKSLFTELILPLEQKLEKDFKKPNSDARKYSQGHKVVLSPFNKASDSLKKFRKKTKNKPVYDNEKEAQYMRTLSKCQEKLDQYRVKGLRAALLEERKCHCFVLQRLCAISQLEADGHRHAVDLYSSLSEWRAVGANPHILPHAADQLIADYMDEPFEPMNGGPSYYSNGILHREAQETQSLPNNEFRRSRSTHDLYRQSNHFDGTKTLPPRTAAPLPPNLQVQAIYSFTAGLENQLTFVEGDLITIMGENSEGWQYGQNAATQKLGWFPLSFTQPITSNGRITPEFKMSQNQRYKSMGDLLDSRSLSEYTHHYDETPGNQRRPKSLYEGPAHGAPAPQAVGPLVPVQTTFNPAPPYSPYSIYSVSQTPDCDNIYQHIFTTPDNSQQLHSLYTRRSASPQHTPPIYSSHGRPTQDSHEGAASIYSPQISPPLPSPPSPPPFSANHQYHASTTNSQLHARANTLPANTTTAGLRGMTGPPPAPPGPPPAPPLPPPPPMQNVPPPPPVSGTKSMGIVSSTSLLSQQSSHVAGNPRMSTSTSPARYASPARQQPSHPPPPIPNHDRSAEHQDAEIEENVDFRKNPMFASVSLRQTKTNDRSAPKL